MPKKTVKHASPEQYYLTVVLHDGTAHKHPPVEGSRLHAHEAAEKIMREGLWRMTGHKNGKELWIFTPARDLHFAAVEFEVTSDE